MKKRILSSAFLILLIVAAAFVFAAPKDSIAGPEIVGDPNGATERYLVTDQDTVKRIVYVTAGAKTMANTTPVASDPVCGLSGTLHSAEVELVGTMAGTAPTLTILWQNSVDGGTTWNNVGTWTQINATVTPATQRQTVADQYSTTAVAYGDCWRATFAFGGTGTVTASFAIHGVEK